MKPEFIDTCIYDVCNDYVLDVCADVESVMWSNYVERARIWGGILYHHKVTNELHYFVGPFGLEGSQLAYMED